MVVRQHEGERGMKSGIVTALVAGVLGIAATFAVPQAWAGDERFSLSSGLDDSANQYKAGPWLFKFTAPAGISGTGSVVPEIGRIRTDGIAGSTQSGLADTEAAASYNIYAGSAYTPQIDLTGKVKVNAADKSRIFGLGQNDYAAQMDVYQSLDKFTAMGSLGSKVLGNQTGITLNPLLYGSFGGVYQFTGQTSTGVDMSLSQDPSATGAVQQELSAYVSFKLDKNFKARGYVLREFSSGNSNNAVGGQVYYGF
jgi:hypothetical protein